MATLTIPHSFVAGTPALASEVNANFQAVVSWTQGQISTDNIGILGARSVALPSSPTLAILSISQTASQIGLNVSNNGTDSAIAINQSGALAAGKAALLINSPSTQLNAGAAEILMTLATNSTIPALLIKHGAVETLSATKDELDLFASAVEISAARVKLPVRTAGQRNAVTQEGSILYNTDTDQVNVRRSDAWTPIDVPVGSIQMYAVDAMPEGWLLCNGKEYLKTAYPKLDAVLAAGGSYPYGETNGSGGAGTTHFRVPNLVGIFPRGSIMDSVTTQVIGGETFNAQTRSTTQQDSTAVNGLAATTGNPNVSLNHTHAIWGQSGGGGGAAQQETGRNTFDTLGVNGGNPNLEHTHSVSLTGDTETRPANISLAFIIKC